MRTNVAAMAVLVAGSQAWGQCGGSWDEGGGVPGVMGRVNAAVVWDPDGPGPRGPVLVVGGWFLLAGDVPAAHLATWDPATRVWAALAEVTSVRPYPYPQVRSLLVARNGDLLVGGEFDGIGGIAASSIARYDGRTWSTLGSGLDAGGNHTVSTMSEAPDGAIVVGGAFPGAGGVASRNLVKWNGAGWEGYTGYAGGVMAVAHVPGIGLVVGGFGGLARGTGSVLERMAVVGSPPFNSVYALHVTAEGDLLVGGQFPSIGGVSASCIARWSGGVWSAMGSGTDLFGVQTITSTPDGRVVIGGEFQQAGRGAIHVALWEGESWRPMDGGLPGGYGVYALAVLPDGGVFAGGQFELAGSPAVMNAARWDGAAWRSLGAGADAGTDGEVYAVGELTDGTVVVGGAFGTMRGTPAARLARLADGSWTEVGGGLNAPAYAMASDGSGGLYIGGGFTRAGDVLINRVGRWDGQGWHALGAGLDGGGGLVRGLSVLRGGAVVAVGESLRSGPTDLRGVGVWNGGSWSALGGGLAGGQSGPAAQAAVVLPNGRLVVGGRFAQAGGAPVEGLAQWDGQRWSPVGTGLNPGAQVYALAVLADGSLAVGGYFNTAGGVAVQNIARWDGSVWSAMGDGSVSTVGAIVPLRSGGCLVGTGDGRAACLRWNGLAWGPVGGGLDYSVKAGLELSDGSIVLGGAFATAGADQDSHVGTGWAGGRTATPFFARWRPCPAEFDCEPGLTVADYARFLSAFEAGADGADFNADGFVDFFDYDGFVGAFEAGC